MFAIDNSGRLQEACGTVFNPLVTGRQSVQLNFTTDTNVVFSGFRLRLHAVSSNVDPCSGPGVDLVTQSGSLSSPNHPADYTNSLACTWTIDPPEVISRVICRFVRARLAQLVNTIIIWSWIKWWQPCTIICTKIFGNRNCWWVLYCRRIADHISISMVFPITILSTRVFQVSEVTLSFTAFNVEQSVNGCWDFVQVNGGSEICGTSLPPLMGATTPTIITFRTDGSVVRSGFHINYTPGGRTFSLSFPMRRLHCYGETAGCSFSWWAQHFPRFRVSLSFQ